MCLSSNVAGVDGRRGEWLVTGDTVQLGSLSGVAVGQQIGRSTISYRVGASLTTTTELAVMPISKVLS